MKNGSTQKRSTARTAKLAPEVKAATCVTIPVEPIDAPMWPIHPAGWLQPEAPAAAPSWTGLTIERRNRIPAPDLIQFPLVPFPRPGAIDAGRLLKNRGQTAHFAGWFTNRQRFMRNGCLTPVFQQLLARETIEQSLIRIDRRSLPPLLLGPEREHREVEVRRERAGVAGGAHVTDHIARRDTRAFAQPISVPIEMRVVVGVTPG